VKIYKFGDSEFDSIATDIKNTFIDFLHKEGIIDYETYRDLALNYGIIIKKPSFFSRLWKRSKYKLYSSETIYFVERIN